MDVTISQEEYDYLIEREQFLQYLFRNGLVTWSDFDTVTLKYWKEKNDGSTDQK